MFHGNTRINKRKNLGLNNILIEKLRWADSNGVGAGVSDWWGVMYLEERWEVLVRDGNGWV